MQHILSFKSIPQNLYFLPNPSHKVYLYLELKGIKYESNEERVPLNISMVVDRSGSMSGDKLKYVKQAVNFVIEQLSADDVLSIVKYDDQVDVVSKSAAVQNKQKLQKLVNNIRSGGTTNLSGGMMEGYNQVRSTKKDGFVNRVLLLSDGLANQGITDPSRLQLIAQKHFREESMALSTFGVGSDYDEKLMTNLSEYGGANYYFIESPEQIPEIFAKELKGLLAVVAQNTHIRVAFPQALQFKKAYGYPAEQKDGHIHFKLNDVFSEEEKAILLEFELKNPDVSTLDFQVDFRYDDVVEALKTIEQSQHIQLKASADQTSYQKGLQLEAVKNIALFVANDMLEQAMRLMDDYKVEEARKILKEAISYLDTHFKFISPSEELKAQYDSILNYEKRLDEMKQMDRQEYSMMQKASRSVNYNMRKKKS